MYMFSPYRAMWLIRRSTRTVQPTRTHIRIGKIAALFFFTALVLFLIIAFL